MFHLGKISYRYCGVKLPVYVVDVYGQESLFVVSVSLRSAVFVIGEESLLFYHWYVIKNFVIG